MTNRRTWIRRALIVGSVGLGTQQLWRHGHDYLFVSFKDKNFSLAERLMGVLKVVGKDFGIKESQVGDMTIRTIRRGKSGATLSYATVGVLYHQAREFCQQ